MNCTASYACLLILSQRNHSPSIPTNVEMFSVNNAAAYHPGCGNSYNSSFVACRVYWQPPFQTI